MTASTMMINPLDGSAPSMQSMQSILKLNLKAAGWKKPVPACKVCHMKFKRAEHLIRHERIHTLERPYKCTKCSSAFARKDVLVRHLRSCGEKRRKRSRSKSHRDSPKSITPDMFSMYPMDRTNPAEFTFDAPPLLLSDSLSSVSTSDTDGSSSPEELAEDYRYFDPSGVQEFLFNAKEAQNNMADPLDVFMVTYKAGARFEGT